MLTNKCTSIGIRNLIKGAFKTRIAIENIFLFGGARTYSDYKETREILKLLRIKYHIHLLSYLICLSFKSTRFGSFNNQRLYRDFIQFGKTRCLYNCSHVIHGKIEANLLQLLETYNNCRYFNNPRTLGNIKRSVTYFKVMFNTNTVK